MLPVLQSRGVNETVIYSLIPGLGTGEGQDVSSEQDGMVGQAAGPFPVWGRWWGNILRLTLGTWRVFGSS